MNYKAMLGIVDAVTISNRPVMQVIFPHHAQEHRDNALALAGTVLSVDDAQEQIPAVEAQRQLKEVVKLVECEIQKEIDTVNDYKKRLWSARDGFLKDPREQLNRVTKLIGDFQTLEQAKARAAEAARNAELAEIERQRAEAMAQAGSHDELDNIAEEFNRAAAALPPIETPRVAGQVIAKDWDITVTDIWALARAMPACVKLEPLIGQIKAMIKGGMTKIPGVTWKEVTKADVRLTNKPKAIEV